MRIEPGARLGPYEVLAPLGAGGMGEVYRARDTKLGRDVALKILPELFASDPERLARFEREAHVLAALNHPSIAQIHGLEESGSTRALVMELVDGVDLADRLRSGPLALDEALPVARQIADALESAHEVGIIHRDLKPANVKLRPDGTVKVLDFGLAKALEQGSGIRDQGSANYADALNSPTITSPAMTRAGMLLGTAAYMAPEQVRGAAVDRRADIWAFGCVCFEMLSGRRAFEGQTVSDTLADVLRKDVDWTLLPAGTPHAIRELLHRCLRRDVKARLRDIGDARVIIDDYGASPSSTVADASAPARSFRLRLALLGAAIAAAAGVGVAVWALTRPVPSMAPLHLSIEAGDGLVAYMASETAISADGSHIAFAGRPPDKFPPYIYVRRVDQLDAKPIAGTEGGIDPFFSPDGRNIGFFDGGKLKIVLIARGQVVSLADAPSGRGGSWTEDGSIIFTPSGSRFRVLLRVPAGGGKPEAVTKLQGQEVTHRWPQVLPGGALVLYTAHSVTGSYDNASLVVSSLDGARRQVVLTGGYHGRYLPSGHLAYIHKGTLFVVGFDLERLTTTGSPAPFLDNVASDATSGVALFAFSKMGTLVYSRGPGPVSDVTIAWRDESGVERSMRSVPGDYASLHFSPTGAQLLMDAGANWGEAAVWSYDWARDTITRLTLGSGGEDQFPIWSPDGKRIAFAAQRDGGLVENIYWQQADGSGRAERVVASDTPQIPWAWHPGGRLIAYMTSADFEGSDIGILPLSTSGAELKAGTPSLILSAPYSEMVPAFSSDGNWLAYCSDESGQLEVYVRSFPGLEHRTKVSTEGGVLPIWSPVNQELFYVSLDGGIWVSSYRMTPDAFVVDKARQWAPPGTVLQRPHSLDLHPDGKRFALLKGANAPERPHLSLMVDAFREVRRVLQAAAQ